MAEPFRFTAQTNLQQALELGDKVVDAFCRLGLKCPGKGGEWCVAVEVETLADAARYHEIPLLKILDELNKLEIRSEPEARS